MPLHWQSTFCDEPELKVTFDSNSYRQAVDPRRFRRDASPEQLNKINGALKVGRIAGYLSETLATLEGVPNAQRAVYFAGVEPKVSRARRDLPDGRSKMGWLLEADDSQHPGLHPTAAEWITAATSLGLRFLRAPRVAAPRPRRASQFRCKVR